MANILEKIYPLGTLVKIKQEVVKQINVEKNIKEVYMVITDRYRKIPNTNTYVTYTGVVYPVGTLNTGNTINFDNNAIEEIISEGYCCSSSSLMLISSNYLILKFITFLKIVNAFNGVSSSYLKVNEVNI